MKYHVTTPGKPTAFDDVMRRHGWLPTAADDWDLHWGEKYEEVRLAGDRTQHVRHFHKAPLLGGKASLGRLLEAARRRAQQQGGGRQWDFVPRTFELPFEAALLRQQAQARPDQIWMAKPVSKTDGRAHFLFQDLAAAPTKSGWVAQEYLMDPHLIGGVKYTLRNFVLVTNLRPLTAFISTLGLAKRCALPYTNASEHWGDRAMHLSNSFVQHDAPGGRLPVWQLDEFAEIVARGGGDYAAIWDGTRRLSALTLLAARESWLKENPPVPGERVRRFELLGLDVMLDANLKPWLLEVNANPAIGMGGDGSAPGARAEWRTKMDVVEQTLQLVGALPGGPAGDVPPRRHGSFELLFPSAEAAEWSADWFPREEDRQCFIALDFAAPQPPAVRLPESSVLVDDGLIAFAPPGDRFLALNETATAVAFLHDEGRDRAAIAAELVRAGAPTEADWPAQIEAVLAELWHFNVAQPPRVSTCSPQFRPVGSARGVVRRYALGAIRFAVVFENEELADAAAEILAHLRDGDTDERVPAHRIDVARRGTELLVRSERESLTVADPRMFLATLHSAMLRLACCAPGVFAALHASVVARAGRAIVLSGPSGRGKTTLAAALGLGGFSFLSDEAALLDEAFRVWPAPVAYGLTSGALPLLPPSALTPDRLAPPLLRRDGTAVHYLRPDRIQREPVPLAGIVFPRVAPGEPTRLEALGPRASLAGLGEGGIEFPGTMSESAIRRLVDGLREVDRFVLHVGSLSDAEALLAGWLEQG